MRILAPYLIWNPATAWIVTSPTDISLSLDTKPATWIINKIRHQRKSLGAPFQQSPAQQPYIVPTLAW